MRALIRGAGLLFSLAASVLVGPAVIADAAEAPEPFLTAPDELLVPGQELQIQGCPDPAAGPLTSDVLTGIQILHDPTSGPPTLNASGVVAQGVAPGVHPVTMECAGQTLTPTATVVQPDGSAPDLAANFLLVFPAAVGPGATVQAQALCPESNEVALSSPMLRPATLTADPEGHQPWALHVTTTVIEDAEPGEYPVSLACPSGVLDTTITVLADRTGTGTGDSDRTRHGQVTRVPKGAPETGGGTQELSTHDISAPVIALGVVLGAVVTAGAIAWREARR